MNEEQLEVLKEYIDACIDDGIARANDSEERIQTGIFKDRVERFLHEVFIESPNRRNLL